MCNIMLEFEFCDDNKMLIGYKHIDHYMIFNVIYDLTCKVWFVANGHQIKELKDMTFSSVIFMLAYILLLILLP